MIIITGGAGLIGSALVWQLNREGMDDILIVDRLGATEKWRNLAPLAYRDYMHKQAFHQQVLERGLPEGTEAVFHMGACSSTTERDADYLLENNSHYSCDLALAAAEAGVRFVYASSAATYGDGEEGYADGLQDLDRLRPLSIYGYSKHFFDLWMKRHELFKDAIGFKFFNVFGVNEYHKGEMRSMVLKAWEQINEKGRVKLFANHRPGFKDGDEQRDFVYVKDVARTTISAMDRKVPGGLYNLGTGKPRSFRDLVLAVFAAMGRRAEIDWVAMPHPLRNQYQYYTCAEMEQAVQAGLSVPDTSLEDAVRDYVTNYLLQGMRYLGWDTLK